MKPDDRRPFAELISGIYSFYNRQATQVVFDVWWAAMERFDLETIRGALSRHCMNPDAGQFLPKPADVVRELGGTSADASMLAWAQVARAVRDVGSYDSVTFDDPITNRVVSDLGGWIWLCEQGEREWPFVEKRFRDAYRACRQRGLAGLDPVRRLPGRIEANNNAIGRPDSVPEPKLIGNPARARSIALGEDVGLLALEVRR